MLFGSSLAPDCLDCHAGHNGVHEMRANTDPNSSVHPENRASTCNKQDCHSSATPALASFDVHSTRKMSTHKLEFGVAMFFVVMTLAILMPILTLNMLGLLRELLPSHEAETEIERLVELAEKKAVREGGIRRFTGSHRIQHAFLVIVFVILCATGLPMKFPEASWSPAVYSLFGGIRGAPIVHRIAGVALLVGFVLHVGMILLNVTRALAREGKLSVRNWIKAVLALPMIPKLQDIKDIIQLTKYVFFLSPHRPKFGRFSWKEKLEYLGLFWGIGLLGVTGAFLWAESLSSHAIPGWVLNICYLAHTYESILAVAHITLVHIPGVIGMPGVSPLSSMILNGKISPHAQAEEHGRELIDWSQAKEVKS
jgi:cytochrome b subunit of formate dehydrogenase